MKYIKRDIEKEILEIVKEYPALVCTGSRKVGKTTLLQNLFPDYTFVSLDLPSIVNYAETNFDDFIKEYSLPIIIDEVQNAHNIFKNLKVLIDNNRNRMGQIILTGSHKFELMKNINESLSGRIAIIELETLSLNETNYKNINKDFIYGGYPELTQLLNKNPSRFYSNYISTYIKRDLQELINVKNHLYFERFLRLIAIQNANQISLSNIASNIGISVSTIKSWLSILEISNQITILEPYYKSLKKRIVKSPKIYFNDTGVLCFLLNITKDNVENTIFKGALFETLVFQKYERQ